MKTSSHSSVEQFGAKLVVELNVTGVSGNERQEIGVVLLWRVVWVRTFKQMVKGDTALEIAAKFLESAERHRRAQFSIAERLR